MTIREDYEPGVKTKELQWTLMTGGMPDVNLEGTVRLVRAGQDAFSVDISTAE